MNPIFNNLLRFCVKLFFSVQTFHSILGFFMAIHFPNLLPVLRSISFVNVLVICHKAKTFLTACIRTMVFAVVDEGLSFTYDTTRRTCCKAGNFDPLIDSTVGTLKQFSAISLVN